MGVTFDQMNGWVFRLTDVFAENKSFLTELDSAIGDADHGINLDRGFSAVKAELQANPPKTIGDLLQQSSMTLIRTVGGASGPLYGTWFLRAAKTVGDVTDIEDPILIAMINEAVEGVKARGKADVGAKTMLDVWIPVASKMREMHDSGVEMHTILHEVAALAELQVEATIPMKATKGRASFLGDRSIGHQDPGATSSMLMINAARDMWT